MLGSEHTADPPALKKEVVNCRKRFERTKDKLRELARKEGLLK